MESIDVRVNVEHNTERKKNQFFIDRHGRKKTFKGDLKREIISMHNEIAYQYFPDINKPQDYILKDLGWIMVGSTVFNCPVTYRKPTEKQIETLKKIKKFHRLIFPYEGENPELKGFMPNYEKYGILCPD